MVDAVDSKSSGGNLVSVQIRPSAITLSKCSWGRFGFDGAIRSSGCESESCSPLSTGKK